MPQTTFSFPTLVEFGAGALERLPGHVRRLGGHVFLVTDRGVQGLPLFGEVTATLERAGVPWTPYTDISPNPLASECERGGAILREAGCDVVVGLGGGSALDAAKGIALMATHAPPIVGYDDAKGGWERISDSVPPIIAIPTTAGTGSEVGRSTVVVDDASHQKIVVFSPHLMPAVALSDAALMVGLPRHLTAATGFDALTHNLEAYLASGYHPLADAIALEGLWLCHTHLVRACEAPADIEAREGMAMAALMGATAFQKGLGAAHSLAHPLSTLAGMHHGLANAIVLPWVVRFNRSAAVNQLERVRTCLRLEGTVEAWILGLREAVGIPHTLQAAGVSEALIPPMADQAFADACHGSNPRPCTRSDLEALYRQAFAG